MRNANRILSVLAAISMAAILGSPTADAKGGCLTVFQSTYPDTQTDSAFCQTCHEKSSGGKPFNPYGDALLADPAATNCSDTTGFALVLKAVEGLDSDGEGNSNIVEINAGTQPGWCDTALSTTCTNSGTPPGGALDPAPQAPPANNRPIADAGGPYNGVAGNTLIQFDGTGSSDADSGDTLTFAWNFGDGSTGSGEMPTHTYGSAATFAVTLVVNDGKVDSDPSGTTAEISAPPINLPPVANPGGPYSGEPGQPIAMDGSGSSDPNNDALTYAWAFGDGSTGTGVTPVHTYAADGDYIVSLTVTDTQSNSSPVATTTAAILTPPANRAPIADAGGPYNGETGANVSFDGSASSDPDGDGLTYLWDFGDATSDISATPTHTYAIAGTYTVSLVVNDGEFDSAPATGSATITNPVDQSDGAALYESNCLGCHGGPWDGPPVDGALFGQRRVAGARECSIHGSIYGTSVFPNGVPEMQFLQGLGEENIAAISEYLNSSDTSGDRRYITACAGCHGNDGSGGRVDEDVHGDSADETQEAIDDENEMRFLACMPASDIDAITDFLIGLDDDNDDDGIDDDEDPDDDNDGIDDDEDDDDDNDGRSDDDEREDGTDPRDHDSDDDGSDDGEEHDSGTDPHDQDSDDDGSNDGDEHDRGTDPLDDDSDDDGLNDGDEHDRGTDPLDPDTDDDGVSDGDEVKIFGTNPLAAPAPTPALEITSSGGGSTDLLLLTLLALGTLLARSRRPNYRD